MFFHEFSKKKGLICHSNLNYCAISKLGNGLCTRNRNGLCPKIVISNKIFRTSCHFYATQLLMFAQNVYSSGIKKALHIWRPFHRTLVNGSVSRILMEFLHAFENLLSLIACFCIRCKSLKLLLKKIAQEFNQHLFQEILMKIELHFIVRIINYQV